MRAYFRVNIHLCVIEDTIAVTVVTTVTVSYVQRTSLVHGVITVSHNV